MKYMDDKSKRKIIRRLKLLEGQVRGLQRMVLNDTYCIDVITQTSAVKQGLSNVEDILLENHLDHCVHHQMQSGQTKKANAKRQTKKQANLDKIITELEKRGTITNDEVEKLLHCSDATASRYLLELVKQGKIKKVGTTGAGVVYMKI